jgi:cytochrome c oxidase cbb3-type subunit 3
LREIVGELEYWPFMLPIRNLLLPLGLFLILSVAQTSFAQAQPAASSQGDSNSVSGSGRITFNASCSACHGLDGRGSDKAVNIAAGTRAQRLSDAQLAGIISNGVPGTGMPAFRTLTPVQVRAVVSYVRSLQGKDAVTTLSGDARRGREIFFGKGDCSSCHSIAGQGGFIGPDLTQYGATSSEHGIRDGIVRSPRVPPRGYRMALIITLQGDRLEGLLRNEDNFSIQLQTRDGRFHLLRRADVQSCENRDGSLMPANYGARLSASELDDLVSYLMKTPGKAAPSANREDDFE